MANTPTILVCDDEAAIRQVVASKLRTEGYEVLEARHGLEGYALCDHNALPPGASPRTARPIVPALVVTDLQMPYMTGLELATRLRAHGPTSHVPVLMLTARGYILSDTDMASTNIRSLMCKPFGGRELIEQVRRLLEPMTYRDAA
jgi:CheY-like chemotaxis protein